MRKKLIKIKFSIVFLAISQMVFSQNNNMTDSIPEPHKYDYKVELPFNSMVSNKSTGSVIIIDVEKELRRDQGNNIFSLINGKVTGVIGGSNTWGTGGAAILVDGIRQSDYYINGMNPMEVESIVILKDALSSALYGAQGDNGVILVTTKRGKAGTHSIRVSGSYNRFEPRAMPEYLNAADYMSRYNEASLNDGLGIIYPQADIDATRSGENPTRYPDNDFYSKDYIKDYTNEARVFADLQGGGEKVQYYVNTEWRNGKDWLNTPNGGVANRFNFRGNLDFEVNDIMTLSVNTTGRLTFNKGPNSNSIWNMAANELPNSYPVFWDPNIITDETMREFILADAKLKDGQLLGGNSSFLNNVYGNLTRNGQQKYNEREVQFGIKLDVDMSFITKGLSGKLYGGMNFYNSLYSRQDQNFAVYEPDFTTVPGEVGVVVHGADLEANKYHVQDGQSSFFRQETYYGTLNYNRAFNKHAVAATAILNTDILSLPNNLQKDVLFHTGLNASYVYDNKYIVETSLMGTGSRKLKKGKKVEPSFSIGYGWVMSEEDFITDSSFIDYLKFRSSYGVTKNDNWGNYFLYKSTFARGGSLNYDNGKAGNGETSFATAPNDITLQKRRDFTIGFDALLFDRAMNLEFGYFKSESVDNITARSSSYPQILGYEHLVFGNYNSNQIEGIEAGLSYKFNVASDFSITAGSNILHTIPRISKQEEPLYEGADAPLMREGKASDAMWGLKSNGLYGEADFNADGSLVAGLPESAFGGVQPGDIKYLDQNGDGLIDNLDQRIIGHGQRTTYSAYLDLEYKNFELFVLGTGGLGDSNYRSGSYFRVMGDVKYSSQANLAYGPNNMDVNAIHPRLSTNNVSNNNRNSDYWIYKNEVFTIPTMQLTYNIKGLKESSLLKDARVYARATNAFVFGKNKKYTEVAVGGSPRTRSIALGLVTSF